VHGLHGLSQKRKKTGKYIASAIVGIIVLFNFYLTLPLFSDASPLLFLSGRLDRGAYLRAKIHDYDSYEFMNRKLPENAKVMFLFTGNDGYYLDREYFYDSYYLGYTVKSILKRTSDGGQVAAVLEEMGITHLFINWRFLDRNFQVSLPAGQIELFNKFVGDYLSPLYLSGDEGVYVLKRGGH
jgi:hypothetical protein